MDRMINVTTEVTRIVFNALVPVGSIGRVTMISGARCMVQWQHGPLTMEYVVSAIGASIVKVSK